jgi:hypothetical protein
MEPVKRPENHSKDGAPKQQMPEAPTKLKP